MSERRRRVRGLVEVRVCAVEGCDQLSFGDAYCPRCREEIDALDAMAAGRDERRNGRFARIARAVRRRLWMLNLAFVGLGVVYIGWQFGALFALWLEGR